MRKKILVLFMSLGLVCIGFQQMATAAESLSIPEDAKFVLQLDLKTMKSSSLGRKLIQMARQSASREIAKKGGEAGDPIAKIQEVLGFDPFEEVQGIVVTASDYEHPERSLQATMRLRKTTGNLEGLLLSLPHYDAKDYGKYEIHSASPSKDLSVFGAIHTDREGDNTVLLGAKRETVTNMLDQLDSRSNQRRYKTTMLETEPGSLITLKVLELPREWMGEGPQANLAKRLQAASLVISQSQSTQNLECHIKLEASTEKQAEQIRQMAQGLLAMVEFAQSIEPDDKDFQNVLRLMRDVQAARDGTTVNIRLSVSENELLKLLDDEWKR